MIRLSQLIAIIFLLIIFIFIGFSCSKFIQIPKKTDPVIPDGELLRYGYYVDGIKKQDTYLITRVQTNENGDILYRIYLKDVAVSDKIENLDDYANWSTFFVINPELGQVIEAAEYIPENISGGADYDVLSNLQSWHFLSDFDKNYVEYTANIKKGDTIKTERHIVSFKPGFPLWDATSFGFVGTRIMDDKSPGIAYMVQPLVMKKPIPLSSEYDEVETVQTKLGSFRVRKIIYANADPFMSVLLQSYNTAEIRIWAEESNTRVVVKIEVPWMNMDIEEVSNIFTR